MKLAVVGSRTFNNFYDVAEVLDMVNHVKPISLLVSGGAEGVDTLAERWAGKRNIETLIFKPEWKKYGKRAGPMRNRKIVESADAVVAFWEGNSPGTRSSIEIAKELKKPVWVISYPKCPR